MTEAEVEEIVRMTATVEPLSSQLQDSSIMLDRVNPPTNTVSSLQYFSPAVSFSWQVISISVAFWQHSTTVSFPSCVTAPCNLRQSESARLSPDSGIAELQSCGEPSDARPNDEDLLVVCDVWHDHSRPQPSLFIWLTDWLTLSQYDVH